MLRMSLYPLQIFTICIILHGDSSTVPVFNDRGGVMCSPEMRVYNEGDLTDDFIWALTQEPDVYDFGLDRSVSPSPPPSTLPSTVTFPHFTMRFVPPHDEDDSCTPSSSPKRDA